MTNIMKNDFRRFFKFFKMFADSQSLFCANTITHESKLTDILSEMINCYSY